MPLNASLTFSVTQTPTVGCLGDFVLVCNSSGWPLVQVCESGGAEQVAAGAEDAPRPPDPGVGVWAAGAGAAAPDAADRHLPAE